MNEEKGYCDVTIRELTASLAEARERLADMTARAVGHAYASDMAEGSETIAAQELSRERKEHRETLDELRALEAVNQDLVSRLAAALAAKGAT